MLPGKHGSLGERSQELLDSHCQMPRVMEASTGHINGLPGQNLGFLEYLLQYQEFVKTSKAFPDDGTNRKECYGSSQVENTFTNSQFDWS